MRQASFVGGIPNSYILLNDGVRIAVAFQATPFKLSG
jgi:hypothetical protein